MCILPVSALPPNIHRPAEQVFAVEEDSESEDMFAMGYEMRPIARWLENMRQPSRSLRAPCTPNQGYRPPFRPVRDYSRIKCFSCGQFGHTQARCPKPDSTLPYKPVGWNMQSDNQQHQNSASPQGNSV